jgi:hypothetical protein
MPKESFPMIIFRDVTAKEPTHLAQNECHRYFSGEKIIRA